MAYTFAVNGKSQSVDVPGEMPLLWVLRDVLKMKGTKFGCGVGQCGACTVVIGGRAVRSCQTPVSTASAEVKTMESLSTDGAHPLQKAWLARGFSQCAYCQAAQIMSPVTLVCPNT